MYRKSEKDKVTCFQDDDDLSVSEAGQQTMGVSIDDSLLDFILNRERQGDNV